MTDMRFLSLILVYLSIAATAFSAKADDGFLKETLPNGLVVIIKHNPDSRVFGVNVLGRNRAAWEQPGKEGITDFVNRLLIKGTADKNAEQIQEALDDIGAQITTNDDPHLPYDDRYTWRAFSFIKFQTIDEYAEKGLKLLYELVASPSFPQSEIEKTKTQVGGYLRMESSSTSQSCRNLFYRELFKNHPLARPVMGTRESVESFTRADLVSFHKKYYSPQNLILAIVSNSEPKTVMKWVKKSFGRMSPYPVKSPSIERPLADAGARDSSFVMEWLDKEQVYIYIGSLTPGMRSADAPALILAIEILSSRLKLNLREKQGLAYSVGADISMLGDFGWYVAAIGTGYLNFDIARNGILDEMEKMHADTVTQIELDRARNSLWGSSLMRNMNSVNQAYNMAYYEFIGLPFNYDDDYFRHLETVTPSAVREVSRKYIDPDNCLIAAVGKIQTATDEQSPIPAAKP